MARRKIQFRVIAVADPGRMGKQPMFDTPEEALTFAGRYLEQNRPKRPAYGSYGEAHVVVEEVWPNGEHSTLAVWKERGYEWVPSQPIREPSSAYKPAKAKKNPQRSGPRSRSPEKIKLAIARSKREILEDVANGTVPATVHSFSELHDYIDANYYGGLTTQRGYMNNDDANAVQGAVDRWIKAGGIRKGR